MAGQDVSVDGMGPSPNSALDELSAVLSTQLLTGDDATPHESPWRGPGGKALAVAKPVDMDEVRDVVRWARRTGTRILPQGAVTGLVGASTPPPEGPPPLVLSTDALTARLDIHESDAVALVDAGVRLSELNGAARPFGLELPVDLAADPSLGAMVATNTGGSRVLTHGDMSHHVLGVEAVIADPDVSVIGNLRGLRKDNTGPDPSRMMIGSAGAFGIVTSVAVALSPIPTERATVLVGPIPDASAVSMLTALRRQLGRELSAFEVMCPAAVRAGLSRTRPNGPVDPGTDPDVLVLVEASGADGVPDRLVEAMASIRTPNGAIGVPGRAVPTTEAWALRHAITEGLRATGDVLGFDLSVRPADLPALRAGVRRLVAETDPALVVADFGHWGDGGVHANVVVPAGHQVDDTLTEKLRERIYSVVTDQFAGSFSAEHGIGPSNAAVWAATTPATEVELLAAFKAVTDPERVLGHPGLPFG